MMNVYQEALNKLMELLKDSVQYSSDWDDWDEFYGASDLEKLLQELVDKSIPKKVVCVFENEPLCPLCNNPIDDDYARTSECCNQRLDWSDE